VRPRLFAVFLNSSTTEQKRILVAASDFWVNKAEMDRLANVYYTTTFWCPKKS
jgi:hypothetical protein